MTVYIELEAYKHYDAHRDHFWRSGKYYVRNGICDTLNPRYSLSDVKVFRVFLVNKIWSDHDLFFQKVRNSLDFLFLLQSFL